MAVGTFLPPWSCCPNHLLTCSYQDVHCCRPNKSPPLPAPGRASPGKPARLRSFLLPSQRLLVQTSVQAKPGHVSPLQLTNIPVPQQVSAPHPAPTLRASPGCGTHPVACSYLPSPASRLWGLSRGCLTCCLQPVRPCQSGPTGEGRAAGVILTERPED